MKNVLFSELCNKEVISCCDCARLGFIIDADIDIDNAKIISVNIELPRSFFSFFRRHVITLSWECIKKIGDDLIITEYSVPPNVTQKKKTFLKSIFGK